MAEGGIYLLGAQGDLVEMVERPYEAEALLQDLLERYPKLLAGDQMDLDFPRRWIVVSRELSMAGEERGVGRLDHAFLDQDGVPTLVEVKRSSDTRIRREVVGQMLDYAANAVVRWPVDAVRGAFETRCAAKRVDADAQLRDLTDSDTPADDFWALVADNLEIGRVRMVFVADSVPTELRAITDFLSRQMSPAEVFAVEVKQFVGDDGLTTLVPRVVAGGIERRRRPSGDAFKRWDEESFFKILERKRGAAEVEAARAILAWAKPRFERIRWGRGKVDGSFNPIIGDGRQSVFAVFSYGSVEIRFSYLIDAPPFHEQSMRRELAERLSAIPGVELDAAATERRPSIPLSTFVDTAALGQFFEIVEWAAGAIRSSNGGVLTS
jgi:hypothetical protein